MRSAISVFSLALAIAQGGCFATPASIADALALNSTTQVCQPAISVRADDPESAVAPALSPITRHSCSTPPRLRPSHCPTVDDDGAESHHLDHLDLQLRLASRTHPHGFEHELLLEAQRKFAGGVGSEYGVQWAKLKASQGYDKTVSLAIVGDYPRREDLTRCGYLSFKCRDRCLCPRCCNSRLARTLMEEFGDVALAGMQAYYICLSLSANADESSRFKFRDFARADRDVVKGSKLSTPCAPDDYGVRFESEADVEQCRLVWKLFNEAIHEFTGTRRHQRFLGAVGGPELSVQFQPLRCLPHANFVIWTTSFTEDDARELRRRFRDKFRNCRPLKGLKRYPSLACLRLQTRDDVRAVLRYSMKPIDLAGQYTRAAEQLNYEPVAMTALNGDVRTFLHNLLLAFRQLPRIKRFGFCDPNHHGYVGHTTEWRAARRKRDAERRRALRQNGSLGRRASNQSANPATPKQRRSRAARFPHWRRAVKPGLPPMPPTQQGAALPPVSPPTLGGLQ